MAGAQANIRTFIAPPSGPGRTAPSFIDDLALHDPLHPLPSGINLLRDEPLSYVGLGEIMQLLPAGSCRHVFGTQEKQTELPALDEKPTDDAVYRISVVCRNCRLHIRLKIDYTVRWKPQPCPNANSRLHHLVHSLWREDLARSEWKDHNPGSRDEVYAFECSSLTCSATVFARTSLPVLTPETVHVLTSKELLQRRSDDAFKAEASHLEGITAPTVMDVLTDLRKYISNARTGAARPISLMAKRFVVRFGLQGLPCESALESMGFTLQPGESWQPPQPDKEEKDYPLQSAQNIFLDDLEIELGILMWQTPSDSPKLPQEGLDFRDASRDLARILGCQDYDKDPMSRAHSPTRAACYLALGVPPNAHDSLIIFAYKRQIETAPDRAPWFLSYLRQIAGMRSSEALQTELAIQSSQGRFDADDLERAYQYFGLSIHSPPTDDQHIIGLFQSRIQDAANMHEAEMRQQLHMISVHRKSRRIRETAEDTLNTYEHALSFLNAEHSTGDDFIVTLYTTKVAENAPLTEKARKAVKMIAEHRKSKALVRWLDTGSLGETEMDPGEAYSLLNIDNRMVEDELIFISYQSLLTDSPNSGETYNKALQAIARDRNSQWLRQHLEVGGTSIVQASAEQPVGLENIGNTCYLNSLLQFFFTVSDLRKIVLDFGSYRMELDEESIKQKRVGNRVVSMQEVRKSQKFVSSLANLFQEMINSPYSSITPKQELARLTLESKEAQEKIRRRSTLDKAARPSLGHIDSLPILGPLGPPDANGVTGEEAVQSPTEMRPLNGIPEEPQDVSGEEVEMADAQPLSLSDNVKVNGVHDNSSEETLVSNSPQEDAADPTPAVLHQQQDMLNNKENMSPTKETFSSRRSTSPDKHLAPLTNVSSSMLNSQAGALAMPSQEIEETAEKQAQTVPEAPNKPPPVPPRPRVQSTVPMLEDYARQQDVTEVIAHCLFQLSCALRPLGHDKNGEQLDEIHNLFYGKIKTHISPSHDTEEMFSSIITRVAMKPDDIYTALDNYFDVEQLENGTNKYSSISQLPPFLAVQLDRVDFDVKTNTYQKLSHHVEMKETIYLDRYLENESGSAQMERRRQTWDLKNALRQVLARKTELKASMDHPDLPITLQDTSAIMQYLQSVHSDDDDEDLEAAPQVMEALDSLSQDARKELDELSQEAQHLQQSINSNFTDMRSHRYRLHAAFFHRGTQGSGHYWVYIFDFKNEIWRKYNDGYVTDVTDTKEIFYRPPESQFNVWPGPANPYFLVYVQDDQKGKLVESIKREIIPVDIPPELEHDEGHVMNQTTAMPPPDVEMRDASTGEPIRGKYFPPKQPLVRKQGNWDDSEADFSPSLQW